ncbi:MAG TPA: ORF6N domain-containing protein [Spirochaetota bacterium]|nr:ORF6N domain-containing protein [Spirochaetota bacterium]HPS87824.1 ORF6N domain-containing protein [Spirochaetota bacterium]
MSEIIPAEKIVNRIYVFRGVKVMLDRDLAELYQVETRRLNEQVKRNIIRFPKDFMFQLDWDEFEDLISQNATSSWGGVRKLPYAFTEHGILMLSNVLSSERAINVSIQIIRAFTQLRRMLSTQEEIKKKIESMEKKYDSQFKIVFDAIKELITEELKPKRKIGFERKKTNKINS